MLLQSDKVELAELQLQKQHPVELAQYHLMELFMLLSAAVAQAPEPGWFYWTMRPLPGLMAYSAAQAAAPDQ
jgi:hypothetical protein